MSIYNKKITIQNHPLTYEKKISINKSSRDGIYAGHGAGNMQIENLINKSTDTKNTDAKTINDMTAGMRVSDYIKTDSSDNMSKKAAVVGSSNSVDMSDTIYARPQAKNEAGNSDDTDMAENLLNDMNQTSENRRNDMIVTASTTTSDDYKAAKDDGYDVIVTETDKIKAVLAKAGVDISIYGDDLSMEQLTDITGSQTEAAMLVNQMKAYDIPATDDNIKAGTDAIDRAKSLTNISNETKAYLVRNNMNPTVSNVYKATYSSSQVQDYRQKTKMTEISDELFEELKPQLKQILEEAHIDSSDENLNQCRWLIDEDIAVTPDNVLLANQVDCINAGKAMKQSLEAAASGYETLMTSPRADMGDSMSKAFQNVDDILKELQIDTSESNRRAVRILAYNSTDITEENIKQIKSVDEQVQRAFSDMTPAVTIEMIKRGISPLDMSMSDISDTARRIKSENPDERDEKFSEFLWKLEKKNEISEEERDSYIGIYRLISQVEQSDGAVIGSLVNQGADITMKNLLTAVRVRGKSAMDYKVDDTFAGVDSVSRGIKIDSQIESAYHTNCLRDVLDTLSPEKMEFVQYDSWLDMTPEQLRQAVYEADEDNALSEQYATEQLRQFNQAVSVPENVYAFLEKYDVKTTAVNLMAASRLMKNPSEAVRNLWERGDSATARALLDETLRRFSESVKNPKELAQAQETLADTAEHVMDSMIIEDRHTGSIDLRQMKLLCSQLRIASNMSRQENYIVPIETADGVTGMKLRIVRGEDKKGLVDIFLEDKKCGRVAAYFEAKENSVSAMIVTDDEQTKKLFEDNITMFEAGISDGEQRVRIDVALEHDISAKESKMSDMKSNTESDNETKKQLDGSESVQTTRLYHIAEQFIVNVQRVIAQDSL